MKYKFLTITGVVLLVLGVTLVSIGLMEREKSVIGTIAAGATDILIGAMLIARSRRLERKHVSSAPADTN